MRAAFTKITTAYLSLMVTGYLLWTGTQGYQQITAAKYHAFLALSGGYVLIVAFFGVESLLVGAVKAPSPKALWQKSSWPQRMAILYLALTWLSAVLSPYFPETVWGGSRYENALTITLYGLCFLLVSIYGRPRKSLLTIAAAAISAFCVLCIAQLYGGNPLGLYPAGYNYFDAGTSYPGAYLGTIGNVDFVASFLCLVIPLFWISLLRLTGRRRMFLLVPLALSLFVLLKMNVLAGLVGVALGGMIALPVALPVSKKTRRRLAAGLLAALTLGMIFLYLFDFGTGLFHEAHQTLHGNLNEHFGSGRIHIWRETLREIPKHLWFGAGPDTMAHANLEAFTRYDEALGARLVSTIDTAHNEYLNILYHQGVFALLVYLVLLGTLCRGWVKASGKSPAAAALGGAALCYCVQAFFGISMCVTAPYFWIVLGLLHRACGETAA